MHWLKKATNPLDPHLRAGGYEVLPVVKLFAKHWNYNPAGLIQEHLLNDSLVAWAINTLSLVRCLREPKLERHNPRILYDSVTGGVFNEKNDEAARLRNTMVRPDHFIQRLTQAEAQKIIARVIRNAERVNSEDRDFYFDWIGIFGSVLRGSETPADVDIVSRPDGPGVIRFRNPPIIPSVEMSPPILQPEHSALDVVAQPSALITIWKSNPLGCRIKSFG